MQTLRLKSKLFTAVVATLTAICTAESVQPTLISKGPDIGPFWQPLRPSGGSYVYADSFVAPHNGAVLSLGTWLNTMVPDVSTSVKFQVWGSIGNNPASGPDSANVLATTTAISGMSGPLSFYSGATPGSLSLTAGDTYWFSATVVGATGNGRFQVGGHTQNSAYVDNGTFWYSNDPAGNIFDGMNRTPEMAFQVELAAIPEPSTGALLLLFAGTAATVRKFRKCRTA